MMLSRIPARTAVIVLLAWVAISSGLVAIQSASQPIDTLSATSGQVTLEDFDDIVTAADLGFNDFSGNMGTLNSNYLQQMALQCQDAHSCALRLEWDFSGDQEAFTGIFLSLFGLSDTWATFDGSITQTVHFTETSLNLDRIDGTLNEPGGPRIFQNICISLTNPATGTLKLRTELKDTQGGIRFTRLDVTGSSAAQEYCWDFRNSFRILNGSPDLNLQQAKVLTFIIERKHVADGVENPVTGTIDIQHIWFTANRDDVQPASEQELLDLLERRAYQYFLDWSSRKPASLGIPQDRSTLGDLLTVGGIGFGLPAHIIAAERGWISRNEAVARTLSVLRTLDNPDAFGSEQVGHIGYQGWFYHFLGVDGRRKLNFDFPATLPNEALNTVELSTIDTGLALMGILAAQSYFDGNDPAEIEIRQRAQAIYDRVNWPFLFESTTQQFYLGWKPNESRTGPSFNITDTNGEGAYSGIPGDPATLDYYTDEALIVILLAVGSPTYPIPPTTYYTLYSDRDAQGLIRTYPGALFTYQFLHPFLDTQRLLLPCPGHDRPNWFANSRQAMSRTIQYAETNPRGFLTYGPDAWGLSAAEGPFDEYHAYGAPPVAVNPYPEEDGTVTYYAMLSAVSFGDDLRQHALSALRKAWQRGHWHSRFGLPDALNDEIGQATPPTGATVLRSSGPWLQRSLFAIDQGPMLLHLENTRSGLIWSLIANNPNIQRALARLSSLMPDHRVLEAEAGSGDGFVMARSAASGQRTVLLHAGQSHTMTFTGAAGTPYTFRVRYSNDNFGLLETVTVSVDGISVGQFAAQDTGDFGYGWNVFTSSGPIGSVNLQPGTHQVAVSVSGGDGYGVEVDTVTLDFCINVNCLFLPTVLKQ